MDRHYQLRQDFCETIIRKITNRMSGSGDGERFCLHNRPRDIYSIGSLSPKPKSVTENDDDFQTDFFAKYAPYSLGIEFLCSLKPKSILKIILDFDVFYRVFPNFTQQNDLESKNLAVVFKRKSAEQIELMVDFDSLATYKRIILNSNNNERFKNVCEQLVEEIKSDPSTICSGEFTNLFKDDIKQQEFDETINKLLKKDKAVPVWQPEIQISFRVANDGKEHINIIVTNCSTDDYDKDKMFDHYMFNVRFSVELIEAEILPYSFNMLEDSYRFKRDMWGIGTNCVVKRIGNRLITETFPLFEQERYGTREKLPTGELLQEMGFKELSENPIPILDKLKEQMQDYQSYCFRNPSHFFDEYSFSKAKDEKQFNECLNKFEMEINRFSRGIELLREAKENNSKYKIVYDAFCHMNETFYKMGTQKGYDRWRPFQIVFIVSQLIDIVAQHWIEDFKKSNDVEKVTVLWFPTGGGKTEAYLGLVIFNLFFDRLRGKENGMTALFRFPLRILSYQQFQRIFNAVYCAGIIKEKYAIKGKLFSIGHWVGNNQTPNSITNKEWEREIAILKNPSSASLEEMEQVQQKLKRVHKCPNQDCNSVEVKVYYNEQHDTLLHKCNKCNLRLPIYIVDTDMYRRLPSIIISTVDKIAVAGMQKEFGNLLGNPRYQSPTRGFSSIKNPKWPDLKEVEPEYRKLLRPTLQIQDELHLLKEDLGAYDSHYETMIQRMLKEVSGNYHWKVIASTATIQDFNRHISHLYGKEQHLLESIRFPEEGPKSDESFYSCKDEEKKIGRFFVGIMGHNKTHINTLVDVLYNFHKLIKELRKKKFIDFNFETGLDVLSNEEKDILLDDYEVSLNYVLTKRNADQVAESIGSQIRDYLNDKNLSGINNEMLTGGTTADQLADVMEKVEKLYSHQEIEHRINSITATSMISHGVDVDRFNFITFFGIPRQTAEYIQASSRIGRKLPGVSFIVFAPQKERDQSYFKYFYKYHEYLNRLVEKPAINRWAKYSIDKTFPGLLLGTLLNNYVRSSGESLYYTEAFTRYFYSLTLAEQKIIQKEILESVRDSYVSGHIYGETFDKKIRENINGFFADLRRNRSHKLQDYLERNFGQKPMLSLRDTEEEKKFYKSPELQKYSSQIYFI
ncbi:DEAD/DEAH box helicase family protein [Paenibacillus elgii]|nr:DEAD/DEAH box helicase family protein [Paenibacillus elgii]